MCPSLAEYRYYTSASARGMWTLSLLVAIHYIQSTVYTYVDC